MLGSTSRAIIETPLEYAKVIGDGGMGRGRERGRKNALEILIVYFTDQKVYITERKPGNSLHFCIMCTSRETI